MECSLILNSLHTSNGRSTGRSSLIPPHLAYSSSPRCFAHRPGQSRLLSEHRLRPHDGLRLRPGRSVSLLAPCQNSRRKYREQSCRVHRQQTCCEDQGQGLLADSISARDLCKCRRTSSSEPVSTLRPFVWVSHLIRGPLIHTLMHSAETVKVPQMVHRLPIWTLGCKLTHRPNRSPREP